jgi:hypothetical protein
MTAVLVLMILKQTSVLRMDDESYGTARPAFL